MEIKEQRHLIMKGKRNKRQRPQSPFLFSMASILLNEEDGRGFELTNHLKIMESCDCWDEENCTEEEEDTANSLILLAQGQLFTRELKKELAEKNNDKLDSAKFSSKRFQEVAFDGNGNGDGKAGYYVYECKTCNRTFPSFQALGGHRASHKKPKPNPAAELEKTNNKMIDRRCGNPISSLPLQSSYNDRKTYMNKNRSMNDNNKGIYKVHECGICRAEFNSGQALGGHMRRHRGVISMTANTVLSLSPMATESDNQDGSNKARNSLSLNLDLNLPAPEVDNLEFGSHLASKHEQQQQQTQEQHQQQQHSLVFSSPKLVDCQF